MKIKPIILFVIFILEIKGSFCQEQYYVRKDYALFFAVDDYEGNHQFNNLKNPINDATTLEKELKEMFGFETVVHKNLTQQKTFDVLKTWVDKEFGEEDQLFIFFSGHGTFRKFTKKGYFIPFGAEANIFGDYIELTDIGNVVTQIPCKHILLAIDACYSGTIDQEIAFKGNQLFKRPNENKFVESEIILKRQLLNKSRLLITSGGKERTPDGKDNSPFVKAILRGLRDSYTNQDGMFTYKELLSRLEKVSPKPHEGNLIGHKEGGFVFVANDKLSGLKSNTFTKSNDLLVSSYKFLNKLRILEERVLIPSDTFFMGNKEGYYDHKMVHKVLLDSFYIMPTEVTNKDFVEFLNCNSHNPESAKEIIWIKKNDKRINFNKEKQEFQVANAFDDHPVIGINWEGAQKFCAWLNGTLPTEAQWEYAAKGRNRKAGYKFSGSTLAKDVAIFDTNSTGPVKSKKANDFNLYGLSGNAAEWCLDYYNDQYYKISPLSNPIGPEKGVRRVFRGGSYGDTKAALYTWKRNKSIPADQNYYLGCRCVWKID